MTETAAVALATFFATIGPFDIAAMFVVLTANNTKQYRRLMAIRGTIIAAVVLLIFALFGSTLLSSMGISLAALSAAGGILLLLIGIEMVFAREPSGTKPTSEEELEAASKQDISVFPIASPLIAGPGTMGAVILLMANADGDLGRQIIVIGSLLIILFVTFLSLLLASQIQGLFGVTGMRVISRVMGILLCALAIQFLFDGIALSGLLKA
ncbi:MAG: MarC family protein [Gammaproteobacteria bacterium]|nr:MarC family protein [Gammaproteobacteria bacterium]